MLSDWRARRRMRWAIRWLKRARRGNAIIKVKRSGDELAAWLVNGYDDFTMEPRHWNREDIFGTLHSPTKNPSSECPGCEV